nr:hypothetical protein Iba_chr09dCG14270 [Ipomoea batatas]
MKKVHKSYTITKSYRSRARSSPGTTSSSKPSNCLTAGLHANDLYSYYLKRVMGNNGRHFQCKIFPIYVCNDECRIDIIKELMSYILVYILLLLCTHIYDMI